MKTATLNATTDSTRQRVVEVAPDVYRLGNELFNWYLIRDGRQFTLVDGGLPAYWNQLEAVLAELGGTLESIKAVLITHAHLDHLGLVERVRRHSAAKVYLHPADARRAARGGAQVPPGGLLANAWRPTAFRVLTTAAIRGVFSGPGVTELEPLQNEGPLRIPGEPRWIFVPGHTMGSVAYWMPDRRTLFAGDALVTLDMLSSRRLGPQLTPLHTNDDQRMAVNSLDRFTGLGETTLLTGHGEPWQGDLRDAVAQARAACT